MCEDPTNKNEYAAACDAGDRGDQRLLLARHLRRLGLTVGQFVWAGGSYVMHIGVQEESRTRRGTARELPRKTRLPGLRAQRLVRV